jgi:hypothetical protein
VHRLASVLLALALGTTAHAGALAQQAPDESEPAPELSAHLALLGGVGARSFELPLHGVVYRTDAGVFPIAGVALDLEHAASASISVGGVARYLTSVGLDIVELHTDGSKVPVEVRAHRFEGGFSTTFRFDDEGLWALVLNASYGVLGFRPLLHLVTPAYSLSGPLARAQLQLPLGSEALRLRAGPEAQWIVQVGGALKERGMDAMGLSLGGEAALELSFGRQIAAHVSYREAWSWIGSSQAQSFKDVARFATAGLTWTP